jgi:LytS/YehU family sensor histidine kinase
MQFYISNKKSNGAKDSTGGIGLENIKRRLMLLYPFKHELNIDETKDTFTIDLKLHYE